MICPTLKSVLSTRPSKYQSLSREGLHLATQSSQIQIGSHAQIVQISSDYLDAMRLNAPLRE